MGTKAWKLQKHLLAGKSKRIQIRIHSHTLTDSNDAARGGQLGDVAVRVPDDVPQPEDGAQPGIKRRKFFI